MQTEYYYIWYPNPDHSRSNQICDAIAMLHTHPPILTNSKSGIDIVQRARTNPSKYPNPSIKYYHLSQNSRVSKRNSHPRRPQPQPFRLPLHPLRQRPHLRNARPTRRSRQHLPRRRPNTTQTPPTTQPRVNALVETVARCHGDRRVRHAVEREVAAVAAREPG